MVANGLLESFNTGQVQHFNDMIVTFKHGSHLQNAKTEENPLVEKEAAWWCYQAYRH
jgi:hypothetical protein